MRWPDLGAALLRVYALTLAGAGEGRAGAVILAQARALEARPPSDAQHDALQAAGLVAPDGRLTGAGRAALAQVLHSAQTAQGSDHENP